MTSSDLPVTWSAECFTVPAIEPADGYDEPGLQAFFMPGEPYHGRATKVFGFLGLPDLDDDQTCPGIVLIHGGAGTAYPEWVRLWNRRGYAAVTVDLCGQLPHKNTPEQKMPFPRHDASGPEGWCTSFTQMGEEVSDHWQYHAVAALLRAHSLLADQPGVDAGRIGMTGISWGGYMTCLMMGIDPRYVAAVPVYGCGYLTDNSCWRDEGYHGASPADIERWTALWDPQHYLPHASMPSLWVTGTNDWFFPLDSLQKSYRLPRGHVKLSVTIDMLHSQQDGSQPPIIAGFMDTIVRDQPPLPSLSAVALDGDTLSATVTSPKPIRNAELCYTRATGQWQDRKFRALPATIADGRISAAVLPATTLAYLNVEDPRGYTVSTPHMTML